MKVLIFSDSHGNISDMIDITTKIYPDYVLFCGDVHRDCVNFSHYFSGLPVCEVLGNNDWRADIKTEKTLELGGVKFFLTHGHKYGVKSGLSSLVYAAKSRGCRVAVYGHTHTKKIDEIDGILCINPGSVGFSGSYIAMDVENGSISFVN